MSKRVAIVGSRDFRPLDWVRWYVDHCMEMGDVLVSGGARGVDSEAAHRARWRGLEVEEHPAQWQRPDGSTNRGAGYERNLDIVKDAQLVVAFWDGESRGTAHSISLAQGLKVDLLVVTPDYVEEWRYEDRPLAGIVKDRVLVSHTKRPTRQAEQAEQLSSL